MPPFGYPTPLRLAKAKGQNIMRTKEQPHPLLVTVTEAAAMLGISRATLDRLTARGMLPVVIMPSSGKVGRPRNMYAVKDLERFIDSHTKVSSAHMPAAAAPAARPSRPRRPRGGSARAILEAATGGDR